MLEKSFSPLLASLVLFYSFPAFTGLSSFALASENGLRQETPTLAPEPVVPVTPVGPVDSNPNQNPLEKPRYGQGPYQAPYQASPTRQGSYGADRYEPSAQQFPAQGSYQAPYQGEAPLVRPQEPVQEPVQGGQPGYYRQGANPQYQPEYQGGSQGYGQAPEQNAPYQPYQPEGEPRPQYPTQPQYELRPQEQSYGGYGNQTGYGNQAGYGNSYGGSYHVPPAHYYGSTAYQSGFNGLPRSSMVYAPQGLNLPLTLQTAISTQVAKQGDLVQGEISEMVSLGGRGYIPAGTQVVGAVGQSRAGRRLSRSGALSIEFTSMRLPSGEEIPITAHLVGDIGKYKNKGQGEQDLYRGEGAGTKVGQFFLRGLGGAGLGAALGTGLGAIAGGSHGVGRGAWGGAAIGGGLGAADMLLRKGKDVIVPSGTEIQIQLDQAVEMPSFANGNGGQGYNSVGGPRQGMF